MERKRTFQPNQHKRYIILANSIALLVLNIGILLFYLTVPNSLYRQHVPLWIYIFTILFILANIKLIFVFLINSTIFVNWILYMCIILIILQLIFGMVIVIVIVSQADSISDNLLVTRKHLKSDNELKVFQNKNDCCFVVTDPKTSTKTSPHHVPKGTPSPEKKHTCQPCARVNKEKARNIAIYLSTGFIINIVIL